MQLLLPVRLAVCSSLVIGEDNSFPFPFFGLCIVTSVLMKSLAGQLMGAFAA